MKSTSNSNTNRMLLILMRVIVLVAVLLVILVGSVSSYELPNFGVFVRINPYGYSMEYKNNKYYFELGKNTGDLAEEYDILSPTLNSVNIPPTPCDTNAVFFINENIDSTYLCLFRFLENSYLDTILVIHKKLFSLDTIISYSYSAPNNILLLEINSFGGQKINIYSLEHDDINLLRTIRGGYHYYQTWDFNQFLISRKEYNSNNNESIKKDYIIYNNHLDSLIEVSDLRYHLSSPVRFNETSNIYHIKSYKDSCFVVQTDPVTKVEKVLYQLVGKEYIETIYLDDYSLFMVIKPRSSFENDERIKDIFIKESHD